MVDRDIDAVMAIERVIPSAPHWSHSDYSALKEQEGESSFKRIGIVAEVAGGVAGFALVRLVGGPGVVEAELESIVVAQSYQGRGLGRSLLSESLRQAKELGAPRFDLEVRASNAAALRLYGRLGFLKTGRRRAYYRDPEEDAVLMSVTL